MKDGYILSLILLGCLLLFSLMDYLCFTHRLKLSLLNFSFIPQINFLTIAPFGLQMSNEHIHAAWSNRFVICTFKKNVRECTLCNSNCRYPIIFFLGCCKKFTVFLYEYI